MVRRDRHVVSRRKPDAGDGVFNPGRISCTCMASRDRSHTHPLSSDLLVLGTHGLTGFDRLMLGSVTEKVLRKAACPVLSVPSHAPDIVPVAPALFRRILCAAAVLPTC